MDGAPPTLGPVQVLVLSFAEGRFDGRVMTELRRLREDDAVRLIDLAFVAKDADGGLARLEGSELTAAEAIEFGALADALVGFGGAGEEGVAASTNGNGATGATNGNGATGATNGGGAPSDAGTTNGAAIGGRDVWFLADAIAPGSAAAIVLLEHRWAIPLRTAIEAGGHILDDAWIHPRDLAAVGAGAG